MDWWELRKIERLSTLEYQLDLGIRPPIVRNVYCPQQLRSALIRRNHRVCRGQKLELDPRYLRYDGHA